MFQLLRSNKKFSMLVLSSTLTQFGSFFSYMLFIVLMYEKTGSMLGTMGIALSTSIGSLIAGLFAGVFVDKIKPPTILILGNLCSGVVLTSLFFLPHITFVYFIAVFIVAICNTFSGTAFTKLQMMLVKKDDLLAANGALQSTRELTKIFAPGAAALVLGLLPIAWKPLVFLIDGSSYFIAVLLMLFIGKGLHFQQQSMEQAEKQVFFSSWKEGISVFRNPILFSILLVFFSIVMWLGAIDVLLSAHIYNLHMPTEYIGYAITVLSIGSIGTIFIAPKLLRSASNGIRIGGAALFIGISFAGLGFFNSIYGILGSMFLLGCSTAIYNITAPTYFQENIPEEKIGRAFSFITSVMSIVSILGLALSGIIGSISSPDLILMGIGCITGICGFISIFVLQFHERKAQKIVQQSEYSSN
ncbi:MULTISPECIES: MFS transporter [Bacillus cereus group]|uniref:MFS transporter n=1 Tax=Bacillus cereus group TaxID=86661 RepID=UPI0024BD33A2|nr:MFS transporter [Bacillus cereus]